jgi:bisphosphoglycerate-dependent phosphoglycerate mutase
MWKRRWLLFPMYTVTMDRNNLPQEPYYDLYRWHYSKQQAVDAIEQAAAYIKALYRVGGREYDVQPPNPCPGMPQSEPSNG